MVWGEDSKKLEDFAAESSAKLTCYELKGEIKSLQNDLNALGFGETMIFPELGSLATELSRIEGWRAPR